MGVAIGRLFLVAALTFGCGASAPQTASGEQATDGGEQAAEGEEPSRPGDPIVTLVGPGEEPRSPLRYKIVRGRRSTMFIDMAITMTIGVGDAAGRTVSTPLLRMAFSTEVLSVSPLGTGRILSTVDRVEVVARPGDPKDLVEGIRRETASLIGLKTEGSLTDRGFARDMKTNIPKGVSQRLRSTLEGAQSMIQQVAAVFPREPVGVGAHWRVESKVTEAMMRLDQTTLVTLVERKDDRVVLSLTVDQTAPKQPLKVPDAPPGTQTTLERYKGHGNGRSDLPLDATSPIADMTVRASLETSVVVDDVRAMVTNEIETVMKFSPTEPR